jgi:hypothetical protein
MKLSLFLICIASVAPALCFSPIIAGSDASSFDQTDLKGAPNPDTENITLAAGARTIKVRPRNDPEDFRNLQWAFDNAEAGGTVALSSGTFFLIIKLNCDDGPSDNGTPGEIDIDSFPALVEEVLRVGCDAVDISGGEKPGDPLRINISDPSAQSFYRRYAEALKVRAPVILGCGNRNVELLEEIIKRGKVDFFCLARPLVRQPDLARQWLEGGKAASECINSNLCFRRLQETGGPVHCVVLAEMQRSRQALLEAAEESVFI